LMQEETDNADEHSDCKASYEMVVYPEFRSKNIKNGYQLIILKAINR
jgi:hypothetical protein